MHYTKSQLLTEIEKARHNMQLFYTEEFINYKGRTRDTDEYYTEVVCEWLLQNIERLNEIPTITRKKGYFTATHSGTIKNPNSNRSEELIALKMFQQSHIPGLGKIIDYQTPLKNKAADSVGKIDLLSYDGKTLRILELKKPDTEETMLRCVIEAYTYWKTADKATLIKSFDLPLDTTVKANPFVFVDSNPYNEMTQDRPKLKKLIETLDCKPLYIKKLNGKYIVTED